MNVKQVFYTSNTAYSILHFVCGYIMYSQEHFVLSGVISIVGLLHLIKKIKMDGEAPQNYDPKIVKLSLELTYLSLSIGLILITSIVYFCGFYAISLLGIVSFLFLTYHSIFDFKYYGD